MIAQDIVKALGGQMAMIEVAAGADLDAVLTRYSRLNPEIVRALRGERFPPLPIHEVWR